MLRSRPGADRDQRGVLVGARGEGIRVGRFEDADFRHADAGGLRLLLHRVHEPALGVVRGLRDDLHAHGALGHPLRDEQRDERAAEAEDRGEDQQAAQVHALSREGAIEAEHLNDQGQHRHDGDVRGNEQKNAFHGLSDRS